MRLPNRSLLATILLAASVTASAKGDLTSTFEDINPGANTQNTNAGGGTDGFFTSGGNSFSNDYAVDPTYGPFWSGWAISSVTNHDRPSGFMNQYASVVGGGSGGSATFAVAFENPDPNNPLIADSSFVNLAAGANLVSIDVTNTAYAYSIMKFGDPNFFARQFRDGDYFRLTITGYDSLGGQGTSVGAVDVYLADFRGGLSFILDTWKTVNLTSLAGAESLRFSLVSTDYDPTNPSFGFNTPAYFAADNLILSTAIPEPSSLALVAIGVIGIAVARRRSAKA